MDRVHLHLRWKNHSEMPHNSTFFPQERVLQVSLNPDTWVVLALFPRGQQIKCCPKTPLSLIQNIVKIFREWSENSLVSNSFLFWESFWHFPIRHYIIAISCPVIIEDYLFPTRVKSSLTNFGHCERGGISFSTSLWNSKKTQEKWKTKAALLSCLSSIYLLQNNFYLISMTFKKL